VIESNEANNTWYHAIAIGPDLTVSAFTAPASAGAGAAITVSDTTRNAGAVAAAATTTTYYLSPNWSYEATDTLLGSRSVAALAPGASDTGSVTVTIPAGTPAGTWYLIPRADAGAAVAESNEANNTAYRAIQVN
jgi:subtilase family serine protease